jgi:DNA-binding Lrp family transcriptional regulator
MAALLGMDLKIIEFVREHGRATMADAMRVTGANRNTLKVRLRSLVETGHLVRCRTGRGCGMGWSETGNVPSVPGF